MFLIKRKRFFLSELLFYSTVVKLKLMYLELREEVVDGS